MTDRCVFCGNPIEADQERTGRGATAAHAACADRALADDAHWDTIAEASGIDDAPEPAPRTRGCLLAIAVLVAVALIVAASNGFAPFWSG